MRQLAKFYENAPLKIRSILEKEGTLDTNSPEFVGVTDLRPFREDYPRLNRFLDSLDHITRKMDFLDTSISEWANGYVESDSLSRKSDSFNLSTNPDAELINDNLKTLNSWALDLCEDCRNVRRNNYQQMLRYFVTGEIGAGKSTTLKRMILLNRNLFFKNRMILSRVEFRKIMRSTRDPQVSTTESLRLNIIDCIYRDINYFFGNLERQDSFVDNPQFGEKFCEYLESSYIKYSKDYNFAQVSENAKGFSIINTTNARNFLRLNRGDRKTAVHSADLLFKNITIQYVSNELNYDFILVFDGFDYVSAADMLFDTENRRLISSLSIVQKGTPSLPILNEIGASLRTHQIVVMRDISYSRYMEQTSGMEEREVQKHFRVIPPSSRGITKKALMKVCNEIQSPHLVEKAFKFDSFLRKQLGTMLLTSEKLVGKEVVTENKQSLLVPNYFNGNARMELYFIRFVIEWLLTEIVPQIDPENARLYEPEDVFSLLEKQKFKESIAVKRYRLMQLLLCRNYRSFRNSIILPADDDLSPKNITERRGISNYVDNILNYDESNSCRFSLLAKIRVCELLSNKSMKIDQIKTIIDHNYTMDIERLIAVMCRTGLLKARWIHNNTLFQTEPLGIISYKYMIKKMEYLEHLFPHICLPEEIRELGIKVYCRDDTSQRRWALASIVNNFVIYQCIKTIEDGEKFSGLKWSWISEEIRRNHEVSVFRAVNHFDRGDSTNFYDDYNKNIEKMYKCP